MRGFVYWPAQSPDLNPIEHAWNVLEKQIERRRLSIKNLQQLKAALQEEWAILDGEFAKRITKNNIYDFSDKSKNSHFDNLPEDIQVRTIEQEAIQR
ncbi:hypothetical protein G6F57_001683 [Rhizopus arrhizus]|uniref:Tc1-like transposase DDE domain-containing protein n=1 Tax=Rhizopus oryzae TaxID=64495 RepID=A0A9P6XDR0_RHIOR|nr:hypothetical protein G6F23_004841 [Rhizopus arrhizus]KAG1423184.1 hypothetical protein G6F58_002941 [Rhizopus delemar]KAG0763960.1 hypothetical protein G6F24_005604 [Rhizopus arrhizus]KAG0785171.1 hypothetical protein G6F22_008052 [Rhizopus arrhizus]KAG0786757.1 hypothetical protein G6F21_008368 [Rhizopus arrhizus]